MRFFWLELDGVALAVLVLGIAALNCSFSLFERLADYTQLGEHYSAVCGLGA